MLVPGRACRAHLARKRPRYHGIPVLHFLQTCPLGAHRGLTLTRARARCCCRDLPSRHMLSSCDPRSVRSIEYEESQQPVATVEVGATTSGTTDPRWSGAERRRGCGRQQQSGAARCRSGPESERRPRRCRAAAPGPPRRRKRRVNMTARPAPRSVRHRPHWHLWRTAHSHCCR
jgi:hypothetical protein